MFCVWRLKQLLETTVTLIYHLQVVVGVHDARETLEYNCDLLVHVVTLSSQFFICINPNNSGIFSSTVDQKWPCVLNGTLQSVPHGTMPRQSFLRLNFVENRLFYDILYRVCKTPMYP